MIGLRSCNNSGGLLFKGFQAQFSSVNGPVIQTFGSVNDNVSGATNCSPALLGDFDLVVEEILLYAVYVDSNDVKGLRFITENGNAHIIKANYPVWTPNPEKKLQGRPIGFKIEFGHTAIDSTNTKD